MKEYIEVGHLKKSVEGLTDCYNGFSDTYDKACIIGLIDEEPVADVVPVVRCKDCKWRHTMIEYTEEEVTSLDELDFVVKLRSVCDLGDDGFCSRGEKVTE